MSEKRQQTLLVTGASGHFGQRVVELLLEAQAGVIVAATRAPDKVAHFSQQGVIVRSADFDDPVSLVEAFRGVDRLLIISTDMVSESGRRIRQHQAAVKAAEQAEVKHVLYTSIVNPTPDSPVLLAADHRATEEALLATRMGWTALRNNIYAETLLPTLTQAVQTGQLFSAAGEGKTAYVTREDCARAAAAALASSFDGHRALDITGPEALSQADLARITTEITGRQVRYVPLELEGLIQSMVAAGLPRPVAESYASFDSGVAQGIFSGISNAFEELTGRKPTSIAEFLTAHREVLL
jgi:NAD(P)H dehydrogenase (quinone)